MSVLAGIKYGVTISLSSWPSGSRTFLMVLDKTRKDSASTGETGAESKASTLNRLIFRFSKGLYSE